MFQRVGEITLTTEANIVDWGGSEPHAFNWLHAHVEVREDGPCVYLWVEETPHKAPVILYIGKAGSTLAVRCQQHSQGFRRSNRGKSHALDLIARIKAGSGIGIYAMWPEPFDYRGHTVASHSSVEDWLIGICHPKPVRNREAGKQSRMVVSQT